MRSERTETPPLYVGSPKPCSKCGEVKPLTEYYAKWGDGRLFAHCKACDRRKERQYKRSASNREKVRAKRRRERTARMARGVVARFVDDPVKAKARVTLNDAVRRGLLMKPDRCEECGEPAQRGHDGRSLLHGHHHDYAMPLDVTWLCTLCHGQRHRRTTE